MVHVLMLVIVTLSWPGFPTSTSVRGFNMWPRESHSAGLTCLPSAGDGTS